MRDGESTWDAPARKLLGFAERVSAQLVANLAIKCQNRARARRLVVKGFKQISQLIEEVSSAEAILLPSGNGPADLFTCRPRTSNLASQTLSHLRHPSSSFPPPSALFFSPSCLRRSSRGSTCTFTTAKSGPAFGG